MRFVPPFICLIACFLSGHAAAGVSIDGFNAAQRPVTGEGTSSDVTNGSILGGEGDVYLQFFPVASSFSVSNGVLILSQTSGANGLDADFSNVNAIQVELAIGSGINMDLNIDYIAVVPPGPVITIDFQSLEQAGTGTTNFFYTYNEQGFTFADSRGVNGLGSFHTGNSNYAGSTMLFNNTESDTSLSREDGGDFDFVGIDLAPLLSQSQESGPITFSGYHGSNLVVSETFNFNGNAGVQHFAPQNAFVKLTEVRWPQLPPRHQFDNVQVRSIGPRGPGPQVQIARGDSAWQLDFSYLQLEMTYTLQKSVNLSDWDDVLTFTAYSPASYAFVQGETGAFYRLQWIP